MNIRDLCIATLCFTLFTHECLSATVLPKEKEVSEEEKKNTSFSKEGIVVTFEGKDVLGEKKKLEGDSTEGGVEVQSEEQGGELNSEERKKKKQGSSSSSSESSSSSDSSSSEQKSQEKSQEKDNKHSKRKRSLDTDQGSLNKVDDGSDEAYNSDNLESTTTKDSSDTSTSLTVPTPLETGSTFIDATTETTYEVTESETKIDANLDTVSTTVSSQDANTEVEDTDEETIPSAIPTEENESTTSEGNEEQSFTEMALARVDKLSDQIREVLYHYRKEGVVVIPGQTFFPEPMFMQEFEKSFSIGTMRFKDMRVYGLSNFTVEHINTDVDKMQVYILLHMKRLVVLGNNTLRTFWSRSSGPFNVTLLNVDSEGVAEIVTTPEGHLEATDSNMNMETKQMVVNFTNLGVGNVFISAIGDAIFNSIKPQILDKVNLVIRNDINKKLKDLSVKFINKVAPIDLAFTEGRKYVREHGYDPLMIGNHSFPVGGIIRINITDFNVKGLSKFNRVGDLSLSMDAGIVQFGIHVLTQKLTGSCKWSASFFGIDKAGKSNFTVDHLQVRAIVNQSLDVRQKPQLDDLDLELGWVRVTMESPMTLTAVIEGVINAFPKLIRHMIVDTIEVPLKEKIQEILNKINVESFVEDNLPRLDSFGL